MQWQQQGIKREWGKRWSEDVKAYRQGVTGRWLGRGGGYTGYGRRGLKL